MAKKNSASAKYFVVLTGDVEESAEEVIVLGVYLTREEALKYREEAVKEVFDYTEEEEDDILEGDLNEDDYVTDGRAFWKIVATK